MNYLEAEIGAECDRLLELQREIARLTSEMGEKLQEAKERTGKKFSEFLERVGFARSTANKSAKVARVAKDLGEEVSGVLGVDVLAQLAQPKYADMIEEFLQHPPETQLEAVDRIKEKERNRPKKPRKPLLEEGSAAGDVVKMDAGQRVARIPDILDQEAITALLRQMETEGRPAQAIAAEALILRAELKLGVDEQRKAQAEFNQYVESGAGRDFFIAGDRVTFRDAIYTVKVAADEEGDVLLVSESGLTRFVNERLLLRQDWIAA